MVCFSYAYAFNISVPIHTLFRACNVIASVILGVALFGQRYSWQQLLCVIIITAGIFLGSIGDASVISGGSTCTDCGPGVNKTDGGSASSHSGDDGLAIWAAGIALLVVCQME